MPQDMGLPRGASLPGLGHRSGSTKTEARGTPPVRSIQSARHRQAGRVLQQGLRPGPQTVLGGAVVAAWVGDVQAEFEASVQAVKQQMQALGNPTVQGLLVLPRGADIWRLAPQVEAARQRGVYVAVSPLAHTGRGAYRLVRDLGLQGKQAAKQLKAYTASLSEAG